MSENQKFGPYGRIPSRLRGAPPEEIEWYIKQRELQKHHLNTIKAGDIIQYNRPTQDKKYYGLVLETRVETVPNDGTSPALKQLRIQWSSEIDEADDLPVDEEHWFNVWSFTHWRVVNR